MPTTQHPNTFVVGAPKCGTTALVGWLASHPQVFVPSLKEPHLFNTDMAYHDVASHEAYQRLYRRVGPQHRVTIDGSVFYLMSRRAVTTIECVRPYSRYLIMLRNPVDMAVSFHNQLVFSSNESIRDFRQAWQLQAPRKAGSDIPPYCRDPSLLQYRAVCSLGTQVASLLDTVQDPKRVLTIFLDDIRLDPRREYLRVLEFLDIADDDRRRFETVNSARGRRWPALRRAVVRLDRLRQSAGIPTLGTGMFALINRMNATQRQNHIDLDLRRLLTEEFETEIALLSELTQRDLSCWLRGPWLRGRVGFSGAGDP